MQTVLAEIAPGTDAERLAALVTNSNLIAIGLAKRNHIVFANAAFGRLFERPGGLSGMPIRDLLMPAHRERIDAILRNDSGALPPCVAEAFRGDSTTFEVELQFEQLPHSGEALLAIFAQDVTDRFRAAKQLNLLAYSDPLTGLANRALFTDRLRQAALATRRTGQAFAVLMLDLDGFKQINDRHGHDAGDLVLQRIASRLLAGLRDSDTCARLGGDEFAVLLPTLKSAANATAVAERLTELARQPIDLGQFVVKVGASAGIAICPEHAGTIDLLLSAADGALYAAKRNGGDRVAWATTMSAADTAPAPLVWNVAHEVGVREIDEQHARLAALLNELAGALRNGQEHAAIFREIIRYTSFHFATEERLMHTCHYDGTATHHDMHRRLLDDLRSLRLEQGERVSVSLTLRYLQEWLLRHVDGADRDLAAALRAADQDRALPLAGEA
jgi:diguanylate cyclase (GGDEF)-like protein/hemerythrin-like metal-binding protein/PAS domain S-box-containing protein